MIQPRVCFPVMELTKAYARAKGLNAIYGQALHEHKATLKMNDQLGFEIAMDPKNASVSNVKLELQLWVRTLKEKFVDTAFWHHRRRLTSPLVRHDSSKISRINGRSVLGKNKLCSLVSGTDQCPKKSDLSWPPAETFSRPDWD